MYTEVKISKFVHYDHSHKGKGFLKKKKGKRFLFLMTMLSFKQVESNHGKRDPCEQDCSWIIKFSCCLNFRYHKYVIIISSIQTQNGCTRGTQETKHLNNI